MPGVTDKYSWIGQDYDLVWTVAVIDDVAGPEVLRAYGADPEQQPQMLTFRQAGVPEEDFGTYFYLQLLSHAGRVVAIENNGWSGDVPEIARRATKSGGRFFSVYWSMTGVYRITQAVHGTVVAHFDPLAVGYPLGDADLHPRWINDTAIDPANPRAACLALLEQQTGLAFDRAWLDTKLPTYRIPDPDVMLKDVENARLP